MNRMRISPATSSDRDPAAERLHVNLLSGPEPLHRFLDAHARS